MNIFTQQSSEPIDKFSFRKKISRYLLIQTLFFIVLFPVMHFFGDLIPESSYFYCLLALLICNSVLVSYHADFKTYKRRFKDIYPDHHLSVVHYLLAYFIPIAFMGLTVFLCLKDSAETSSPAKIFKIRYAVLALVPLIFVQVFGSVVSYWTISPSGYYLLKVGHDGTGMMKFKSSLKANQDVFAEYRKIEPGKLSPAQMILLVATTATSMVKDKSRSIASGMSKEEAACKYGLQVLDMNARILEMNRTAGLQFTDYSPLSWFAPSGISEIIILSLVDQKIMSKLAVTIDEKSRTIASAVEKTALKLESPRREAYLTELSLVRTRLVSPAN